MSSLDEVGDQDGWRCWLCDEPVDPSMSVNDPRGPSIDSLTTKSRSKSKGKGDQTGFGEERLAHRACNTKKGAIAAVVAWNPELFIVDPAPIVAVVERLQRKGGREIIGRCPTEADAQAAADWFIDRLSRLVPDLVIDASVEPGGGQWMVAVMSARH
jgi:hypothetical protein